MWEKDIILVTLPTLIATLELAAHYFGLLKKGDGSSRLVVLKHLAGLEYLRFLNPYFHYSNLILCQTAYCTGYGETEE